MWWFKHKVEVAKGSNLDELLRELITALKPVEQADVDKLTKELQALRQRLDSAVKGETDNG